jgi:hypothetical protein
VAKFLHVISGIADRELKYRLVYSFEIPIHNFSLGIHHTVDFHDLDIELESGQKLLSNIGLLQLGRIVEDHFCVFEGLFLKI